MHHVFLSSASVFSLTTVYLILVPFVILDLKTKNMPIFLRVSASRR